MKIKRKFIRVSILLLIVLLIWFQWWHLSKSIFPLEKEVQKGGLKFMLAQSLPTRVTEAGGIAYGKKFYLLGGIDAFGRTTQKFWEYDPEKDEWKRLPDLPVYINHPAVVASRNKIFVVGGFGPIGIRLRWLMFADWKPLNTVYVYDISSATWSPGKNMPVKRGAGGVAICDTAIWYTGGINEEKKISNAFHYFSFTDSQWRSLPAMPTPRDHMRMEWVNGKLYAISGRKDDLRKNLGAVEVFDAATKKWTSVDNIPTPRGGFGSAVVGKYIYTFGGESFFDCFGNIERLDTETGRWEKLPSLPEARHGIVCGVIDGKVHLVSGGRHPRISTSNIHRVLEIKNSNP